MQIGNGAINLETDERGQYEYYGSHGLVSDEITDGIMKYCYSSTKQPHECTQATQQAGHLAGLVNTYNIYAPWCTNQTLITQYPNKASVSNSQSRIQIQNRHNIHVLNLLVLNQLN